MYWIIPVNHSIYDHENSFNKNKFIDWKQNSKFEIGDIVYLYSTSPIKRIQYKCLVIRHSFDINECIDDSEFCIDRNRFDKPTNSKYFRIKLLKKLNVEELGLEYLKMNGLNGPPQRSHRISEQLYNYIDKFFSPKYEYSGYDYQDEISQYSQYNEGHYKKIYVNKYERSLKARKKCIEYHRESCLICGMNFGEKYGNIGKGFTHIHHLKPLHKIRKNYTVNYKDDLIPVCPNCHAMIHHLKNHEKYSIDELKELLNK